LWGFLQELTSHLPPASLPLQIQAFGDPFVGCDPHMCVTCLCPPWADERMRSRHSLGLMVRDKWDMPQGVLSQEPPPWASLRPHSCWAPQPSSQVTLSSTCRQSCLQSMSTVPPHMILVPTEASTQASRRGFTSHFTWLTKTGQDHIAGKSSWWPFLWGGNF
jgi:hypothetical protein